MTLGLSRVLISVLVGFLAYLLTGLVAEGKFPLVVGLLLA